MIMDSVEENGSNIAPEQTSAASTNAIVHLISSQSNPAVHQVSLTIETHSCDCWINFFFCDSFFFKTHVQSSVIQPNQQSVIQTATGNIQPVKSVLLVNSKPNSVIHTTQAIQVRSLWRREKKSEGIYRNFFSTSR